MYTTSIFLSVEDIGNVLDEYLVFDILGTPQITNQMCLHYVIGGQTNWNTTTNY